MKPEGTTGPGRRGEVDPALRLETLRRRRARASMTANRRFHTTCRQPAGPLPRSASFGQDSTGKFGGEARRRCLRSSRQKLPGTLADRQPHLLHERRRGRQCSPLLPRAESGPEDDQVGDTAELLRQVAQGLPR